MSILDFRSKTLGHVSLVVLVLVLASSLQSASPLIPSNPRALVGGESVIDLPGVHLWVKDSGGSGIPIVLLHPNTANADIWSPQFEAFVNAGFRTIAFDRRGVGRSLADPKTGAQPGTAADDLDALADYLRLDRFHVVGIAGGGFVALDYVLHRGDRLRSVVVAASPGGLQENAMLAARESIRMPGWDKMPADFREIGPSYRIEQPEGVKRWAEIERNAHQPGAVSQPMRTTLTFAKLESLKTPALVLAGGADLIAPPALMRMWAKHIVGVQFVVIPDAGHALAWERPEAFNNEVITFLRRH